MDTLKRNCLCECDRASKYYTLSHKSKHVNRPLDIFLPSEENSY
jgi:hypothetical protein